jgi:hypothetical protein
MTQIYRLRNTLNEAARGGGGAACECLGRIMEMAESPNEAST